MPICDEATADSEKASNSIWRHGHELRNFIGIAESLDNGGEENGDGVQGNVYANGDEHVHPDLPVFQGIHGKLELKLV